VKGFDELLLGPEDHPTHRRVRSVRTHYEVRQERRAVGERDADGVVGLFECGDARVEAVLDAVLGVLVQHVDEVAAQDLQLRHHAVAVECLDRHLRSTAAVDANPGNAPLAHRTVGHLVE
jgi:hypothetical protein